MRIFLLLFILCTGVSASYFASDTLRSDAEKNWKIEADQVGQWLTATLLGWLEESYAPLSGLAALSENSESVSETEFLNAYDGLEARASAFFLETAALIEPIDETSQYPSWQVKFSTDETSVLYAGSTLSDQQEVKEAVNVAKARFGETVLGKPLRLEDETIRISPVTLGTYDAKQSLVVVGLVDYNALITGLFDLHVPDGLAVSITAKFPEEGGQSVPIHVAGQKLENNLHSLTTRTVSAGAELSITWDFSKDFRGGPSTHLANFTLAAGSLSSIAMTLFIGFLLRQNKVISQKVHAATRELSEKEAQLRLALENMPGAMFVVDEDLKLVLLNDQYQKLYGDVASEHLQVGKSMIDVVRAEAEHGLLSGEGGVEDIVAQRIASFKSDTIIEFEDKGANGRDILLIRKKEPGGHTITIATDVSERKEAERKLKSAYSVISDSIDYASNIQRSLLPPDQFIAEDLKDYFIVWEPRDVVGGDIYWYRREKNGFYIILADCTGHGVPGAFMTIIATGALDRALRDHPGGDPATLLSSINRSVKKSLGQDRENSMSDDGLEMGICHITQDQVVYAGARFSLFHTDGNDINIIKGDKVAIGYRRIDLMQLYTNYEIPLSEDQYFYLVSDGLIDQIGGDGKRRFAFGKKRFKTLLSDCHNKPFAQQKKIIMSEFEEFQGQEERRDDVSLIGFKVN